ncbi:MAG: nucleoside deaminase [Bdellovibrionales bacterium]|nr:nucleoside deaminase [Bdellovibrionales bacterium]
MSKNIDCKESILLSKKPLPRSKTPCKILKTTPPLTKIQIERDKIFSLLAFAVAEKRWQSSNEKFIGHNIAAILVDKNDKIVCWGRNTTGITNDATQHAETRLIRNFLQQSKFSKFLKHRIYVTFEPCVMCAGMIAFTGIESVIYGQEAGPSGGVFERLNFDSREIGGYCPYWYHTESRKAPVEIGDKLVPLYEMLRERTYKNKLEIESKVHDVFIEAKQTLLNFKPTHIENVKVLNQAISFLDKVPAKYSTIPYTAACDIPNT